MKKEALTLSYGEKISLHPLMRWMDNMDMNILMVTSETVPFSKSGGLADVVGALSQSLSEMGHEIRVFMPMYSCSASDMPKFETTHSLDNFR